MPKGRDSKDKKYFDQDEFLAEVRPVLYRFVLTRISDPETAREVVQDSILGFLKNNNPASVWKIPCTGSRNIPIPRPS